MSMKHRQEFEPQDVPHITRPVDMVRLFNVLKNAGLPIESIAPRKDGGLRVNFNATISAEDEGRTAAEIASYDPALADDAERAEWTAITDDLTPLLAIDDLLAEMANDQTALQTAPLGQVRAILLRMLTRQQAELRALRRLVGIIMKS